MGNRVGIRKSAPCVIAAFVLVACASPAAARICDIKQFLDECPHTDAAFAQISKDFKIRREGKEVGSIACQSPVSSMPIAEYTDELIVLQALRTIYYLDGTPLPWTNGRLYDWLKARAGGINIVPMTGLDRCCSVNPSDQRNYFDVRAKDDATREWQRSWVGMSELIGLFMHERRHAEGNGYPHVSCCKVGAAGCDQEYNEKDLSPFGIQWWLRKQFVEGGFYTGYACMETQEANAIKTFLRTFANAERDRFCSNPPPVLTDTNNPPDACKACITRFRDYFRFWRWIPPWIPISILVALVAAAVFYRRARQRSQRQ